MSRFKLGAVAESTGLPVRSAIETISRLGAEGVQANAVGALSAEALSDTGRREFRNLLHSLNLELTALGCPLRDGLDVPEHQQKRIDSIRRAMQLAFNLGARRVVVPFPKIPDPESPAASTLRESLLALAAWGDHVGTVVCLEAGLDDAAKVKDYLATYDTGSLRVNYDPANFLINGHDPLASAALLSGLVAHVHARDAKKVPTVAGPQEVAVGAGDIEWMALVATLESIEYRGFLTVERTMGDNRIADLTSGVRFLRRFAPRSGN